MKQFRKIVTMIMVLAMTFALVGTVSAEEGLKEVKGAVVEVQKYGNVIMDVKAAAFYDAGYELGDMLKVNVGEEELEMPFCTSYSDVDTGSLLVRDNKEKDVVIVAINMGNFAKTYNAEVGTELTFSLSEKEGYLAQYLLHQLKRTNERSDYATDAVFANFRNIETSGMAKGVLYRSSSPINNELGRAAYSNALVKDAGVKTVMNLADSKEEIAGYIAKDDFNSEYYKSLYDAGQVKCLNMTVDIAGEDFGKKLAEGFKFLSKNEGPYLVHCTEGKDRAGFASAVLECLMGASLDEVVDDYMVTYKNYYKVEEGSEQYNAIIDSNIMTSLTTVVCGLEKGTDISKVDLSEAATKYLTNLGMTVEEISSLKTNLSTEIVKEEAKVEEKKEVKAEEIKEVAKEEVKEATKEDVKETEKEVAKKEEVKKEEVKKEVAVDVKKEETAEKTITETNVYVVVKGDCLWNVAMRELGDGNRFGEIYELNKETIKNPRVVLVGQELKIPMNK
ncbi:MAG: SAM-dependent chlorinase/fluorinase [Tissierellales bacterium]|jgi:hypothetical protein|nr:SAM-dependent chlorinase/fluorinase [Tissierellales bacterium]